MPNLALSYYNCIRYNCMQFCCLKWNVRNIQFDNELSMMDDLADCTLC